MNQSESIPGSGNWVAGLWRFLSPPEVERCAVCTTPIATDHTHLIEPGAHRLLCVCEGCGETAGGLHPPYRRVPPGGVRRLDGFVMTDPQWEALLIPSGIAFFYYCSVSRRMVAMYPGAAGATETALDPEALGRLAAANPVLDELEPDVEALLINRADGAGEYYRVPIDRCYILVGLIRRHWRGSSGGGQVREAVREFFAWLRGEPEAVSWGHG